MNIINNQMKEKNTKETNQKGITLIALVITIVVLLILSAIAISSITKSGILDKAEESKTEFGQASVNETSVLEEYDQYIAEMRENIVTQGPWVGNVRGQHAVINLIKKGISDKVDLLKYYFMDESTGKYSLRTEWLVGTPQEVEEDDINYIKLRGNVVKLSSKNSIKFQVIDKSNLKVNYIYLYGNYFIVAPICYYSPESATNGKESEYLVFDPNFDLSILDLE